MKSSGTKSETTRKSSAVPTAGKSSRMRKGLPLRTLPVATIPNINKFWLQTPRSHLFMLHSVTPSFGAVPGRLTHPGWAAHVGFPGGAYLTLLTYQFLHGGWLHIISNMWALWIFGDNVEDAMGHFRYAVFYLACGVLAGLTQTFTQPGATVPSLGASGAIAGVLGAYLLLYSTARLLGLLPIFFLPSFF